MARVEQQRLPSLTGHTHLFAHRGARAHAPENTMEAFALALRLGATGLETDAWITRDGVVVLDHDGKVQLGPLRSKRIEDLDAKHLPPHIPRLTDLIDLVSQRSDIHLSIDIKNIEALRPTYDLLAGAPGAVAERSWLCHPSLDLLIESTPMMPRTNLVNSVRLGSIAEGVETRAARLSSHGVRALNMRGDDWNGGLVTLVHRFGLHAFSWNLQHEHELRPALRMGVDAVYSDHVDRMVDAAQVELHLS